VRCRAADHIASIAHGITDRDASTGRELLADVNPTFNWVRLAQRVPVRIALDPLPQGLELVAGTTCTVIIRTAPQPAARAARRPRPGRPAYFSGLRWVSA
jgi:multidrug resistance efflux pump